MSGLAFMRKNQGRERVKASLLREMLMYLEGIEKNTITNISIQGQTSRDNTVVSRC